ncbi:phosphoesterase [Desulfuromonas versatilis]|uniref:Phosphoesterase n=1 Tax=Desulfuromonas versatilis TaxID=2802975 RepID=A0ABN6DXQ5_9BACT|nr:bifunctional oligoribonuclease/PAP phosphatase NrnA [Desulfuromonas versatilis]BCR04830.1 phosphoesterase [Desulfuromonas versatilis]
MIKAILKKIDSGRRFLVASHESPDGDAMASTLALTNLLREMGKEVVAFNRDGVPESFRFLPGAATVVSSLAGEAPFDAGFVLDAGELRRAGNELKPLCRSLVNIDHHPHSEDFGEIYYVDENASATGIMIYRIAREGGLAISPAVALCVYTAILSDTGSFRYSNADPEAFRVAGEMIDLGVDPWSVASGLYESQSEKRLQLLGEALNTLTISPCRLYASVSVTSEMLVRTGATAEHTDGFVNYPRSISGVEVALFFRQVGPAAYKVGFRSKGKVDVGSLARALGGGGHHNAAGAVVEGELDHVRATVFARLDALLK